MELTPAARSGDGFLICQQAMDGVPFGAYPSSRNGCGWIAAYNCLRADLHPVRWDQVRRDLQHLLPFRGKLGANVWVLRTYLRLHGCHLRSALCRASACELSALCRAGIIMFWTGKQCHYVAFQRAAENRLRFFNVDTARTDVTMTMDDFYHRFVKGCLAFTFVTVA